MRGFSQYLRLGYSFLKFLKNLAQKSGDFVKKIDFLSTLFVGIDVSSSSNVVCAIDFNSTKHLQFSVSNNHNGAVKMVETLLIFLHKNKFKHVVVAPESTSFYSIHIANFLSSEERLLAFNPYVYFLNPKMISNYRKSFIGMSKTDPLDAFIIANFAHVGRINTQP